MGDPSTHAVFFQAYWHLCFAEDDEWVNSGGQQFQPVCKVGEEDALIELKR